MPAPTPCPRYVGTLRRNILACVIDNELFTAAEQLQTNHNTHECGCPRRLALWLQNVRRIAGEREYAQGLAWLDAGIARFEAQLTASVPTATAAQCDELYRLACHPALTPAEKAQVLDQLPTITQGAATATIGQLYATVLSRPGQRISWRRSSTLLAA